MGGHRHFQPSTGRTPTFEIQRDFLWCRRYIPSPLFPRFLSTSPSYFHFSPGNSSTYLLATPCVTIHSLFPVPSPFLQPQTQLSPPRRDLRKAAAGSVPTPGALRTSRSACHSGSHRRQSVPASCLYSLPVPAAIPLRTCPQPSVLALLRPPMVALPPHHTLAGVESGRGLRERSGRRGSGRWVCGCCAHDQ